ncbi:hypothetical protein A4X13_0g5395 [Tilletia indica]|uniref:Uncharacterized protein n=1 Tax=Tilletia indica TaxID=43049 RepID=A0A177TRM4_9BASI|nr:hypothetical protein A4X13_0g5395 [Tilletia indica]
MWYHLHLIPLQTGTEVPSTSWPAHEDGHCFLQPVSHPNDDHSSVLPTRRLNISFNKGTFFIRPDDDARVIRINGSPIPLDKDTPLLQSNIVELRFAPDGSYSRAFTCRVDLSASPTPLPVFPGPYTHTASSCSLSYAWLADIDRALDDSARHYGYKTSCPPLRRAAFELTECTVIAPSFLPRQDQRPDPLPAIFRHVPTSSADIPAGSAQTTVRFASPVCSSTFNDSPTTAMSPAPSASLPAPFHPSPASPSTAVSALSTGTSVLTSPLPSPPLTHTASTVGSSPPSPAPPSSPSPVLESAGTSYTFADVPSASGDSDAAPSASAEISIVTGIDPFPRSASESPTVCDPPVATPYGTLLDKLRCRGPALKTECDIMPPDPDLVAPGSSSFQSVDRSSFASSATSADIALSRVRQAWLDLRRQAVSTTIGPSCAILASPRAVGSPQKCQSDSHKSVDVALMRVAAGLQDSIFDRLCATVHLSFPLYDQPPVSVDGSVPPRLAARTTSRLTPAAPKPPRPTAFRLPVPALIRPSSSHLSAHLHRTIHRLSDCVSSSNMLGPSACSVAVA